MSHPFRTTNRSPLPTPVMRAAIWLWACALAVAFVTAPTISQAALFFVNDTIAEEGVSKEQARTATNLIRDAVSARQGDNLSRIQHDADYTLQPRLMQLGDNLILTVEKVRGDSVLFAAQSKIDRIEQLDQAARNATFAAIDEPSLNRLNNRREIASETREMVRPYRVPEAAPTVIELNQNQNTAATAPAAGETIGKTDSILNDPDRKVSFWTIGAGPAVGRRLDTDSPMLNFAVGRLWMVNPRASVNALGQFAFASGDNEEARLFDASVGASYYFEHEKPTAPYATTSFGWGFAQSGPQAEVDGISFAVGAGAQFFRDTDMMLDLQLRYTTIVDDIGGAGNPAILGLRLATNF